MQRRLDEHEVTGQRIYGIQVTWEDLEGDRWMLVIATAGMVPAGFQCCGSCVERRLRVG